jgi:hypothetical protein
MTSMIVTDVVRGQDNEQTEGAPRRPARRTIKLERQPPRRARADGTERIGRVLRERWRVEELIWKTPESALYWATHRTGTRVAIQVLFPELSADPQRQRRFVDVALRGRMIEHDGVVRVLDDDVDTDGALFLVLELFEATSLAWMFDAARGRFDLGEALRIGDGLLDVLAAAHAKGIQHGALAADEVFVTRQGQIKVLGFQGELDSNFQRDTAAAGRILFTMVAGSPPNGRSLGAQEAYVPEALVEVVDRALGVADAEPWRDAGEMQVAFRAAAQTSTQDGSAGPRSEGGARSPSLAGSGAGARSEGGARSPSLAVSFRISGRMNPLFLGPIAEPRPPETAPAKPERKRRRGGGWLVALALLALSIALLVLCRS